MCSLRPAESSGRGSDTVVAADGNDVRHGRRLPQGSLALPVESRPSRSVAPGTERGDYYQNILMIASCRLCKIYCVVIVLPCTYTCTVIFLKPIPSTDKLKAAMQGTKL